MARYTVWGEDYRPGSRQNVVFADEESRRQFITSRQHAVQMQLRSSGQEDKHIEGSVKGGLWDWQLDYYARLMRLPNYQPAMVIDQV